MNEHCETAIFAHMLSFFEHMQMELQGKTADEAKRIILHREKLFFEMLKHFNLTF